MLKGCHCPGNSWGIVRTKVDHVGRGETPYSRGGSVSALVPRQPGRGVTSRRHSAAAVPARLASESHCEGKKNTGQPKSAPPAAKLQGPEPQRPRSPPRAAHKS